ncbi:MAG: RNA polymerase factor sigma-54 [Porphyromonadaceae bacterium]|nr:RNA polymerase factor sigma-54 [Porphyromonadaceae bacterium]
MNRLTQQQRLEQGLTLSPAQIQAIKMLELTTLELETRIERELEENPALEESYEGEGSSTDDEAPSEVSEQDWELGEYASEDDIPAYKLRELQERQAQREDVPFSSSAPSIDELLMEQLGMTKLTDRERELARYIIGNLSAEGYLDRSIYQLQDDLLFKVGIEASEYELLDLIKRIQRLEPAGIAARDLQECLILQLERRAGESRLGVALALTILRHYYDDFVNKRFDKLCSLLEIGQDELSEVYALVAKLNPRPTSGLGSDEESRMMQYAPDFIVSQVDGELTVALVHEREITPLRLSPTYLAMLDEVEQGPTDRKRREAMTFLKHKVEQARWFIDAVAQRQNTLRQTMLAIVAHQHAFFLSGELADLRPMVLRDIAEATGLDISTISRVSNSKSVQTDYGVYPLKFFFGEGITNDEGEEISTRQIKQALERLIWGENKRNPYTDAELVDLLAEQGYPLARRTVAKYREQLRLPVARLRREL